MKRSRPRVILQLAVFFLIMATAAIGADLQWAMRRGATPASAGDASGTVGSDGSVSGGSGDASGTVGGGGSISGGSGDASGTVGSDGSISGGSGDASGTVGGDGSISGGSGDASGTVGGGGSISGGGGSGNDHGGTSGPAPVTPPATPQVPVAVTPPSADELVENWQENPYVFLAGPYELPTASVQIFDPMREKEIIDLEATLEARLEPAIRHILIDLSLGGNEAYYQQIYRERLVSDGERERGLLSRETRLAVELLRQSGKTEQDLRPLLQDQLRNVDDRAGELVRRENALRPLLPELIDRILETRSRGERRRAWLETAVVRRYSRRALRDAGLDDGEEDALARRLQELLIVILDRAELDGARRQEILAAALAESDAVLSQAANRQAVAEAYSRQLQAAAALVPSRGYSQSQEVEFTRKALRTEMPPARAAKELVDDWRRRAIGRALELWQAGWRVHTLDSFRKVRIGNDWVIFYRDRPATGFEADLIQVKK